ncbi:MAG: hypothetical protein QW797_07925, partial [Thermoproteota archaeon]
MVKHAWLGGLLVLLFTVMLASLYLNSSLHGHSVTAAPSSYSWSSLSKDSVTITYSVDERIWYGGTGYLRIDARPGRGTYSNTKSTTATVTIP